MWLDLGRANLAREAVERAEQITAGQPIAAVVAIVRGRMALQLRGQGWGPVSVSVSGPGPASELLAPLAAIEAALLKAGDHRLLRRLWLVQTSLLPANEALARLQQLVSAADWPLDMPPAEVHLTFAHAAQAAGDSDTARAAAGQGQAWVQQVAQTQVDEIYRDGWLQRNPVNRALLTLAAQLGREDSRGD